MRHLTHPETPGYVVDMNPLTYNEAAARLSVSRATVYRMVKAGTLERIYVGGRIPRITAESVEAALTSERAS